MYDSYDTSTYDSYSSSSSSPESAAVTGVTLLIIFSILFVVFAVTYVLLGIFLGKIFKKAGVESWIAWVPVYNTWKWLQIGGQQGFWAILAILPFVNLVAAVFMYISMYNVGLKLQKSGAFVLLGIFLPLVWVIWLGADSSKWDELKGAPRTDTPQPPQPQMQPPAAV